jgi:hypothetical protein
MTIHTAANLRNRARRLDRKISSATTVLAAMRGGQTLQLQFTHLGHHWTLSGGQQVSDNTAKFVIQDRHVVDVSDVLFRGMLSQTWRYVF